MAVDSNFDSLFQNLKLDGPWLPSKTWESISSESGFCHSENPSSRSSLEPHQDPNSVSEVNLVRLVLNAMQGLESALTSIQRLSELFCTDPADRTTHRITSLWQRSSSTHALGKILRSICLSGFLAFLLRKFVDYFLRENSNISGMSMVEENKIRQVHSQGAQGKTNYENGMEKCQTYSLVNQSFAIAVEKVLEGYICSLDTLYESVWLRRSSVMSSDASSFSSFGVGSLTSVVHSEITFLEVYLHTKELRTRIEALGNICFLENIVLSFSTSSFQDLASEAVLGFCNFPIGADLLTYLYAQLRDADPVHCSLIKFLFTCSCEPYCGFIKSWIYQARINDPFKEFIVECADDSTAYVDGITGVFSGIPLPAVKVRDGVSIPCFLEDLCLPLLRAGQQLLIVIKLLKLCHSVHAGDQDYEDIIPYWDDSLSGHLSNWCSLTFNNCQVQEMVLLRETLYMGMQAKLQDFFSRLDIRHQQRSGSVMALGTVRIGTENITGSTMKNRVPFALDENLTSLSTGEIENSNLDALTNKSDASSATSEILYEVDDFESSACSSLSSSVVEDELVGLELHGGPIEAELRNLSGLGLLANLSYENILSNPSQSEEPYALGCSPSKPREEMGPISHSVQHHHQEPNLNLEDVHSRDSTQIITSQTQFSSLQSVNFWPLGILLKNPFHNVGRDTGEPLLPLTKFERKSADREIFNGGSAHSNEVGSSDSTLERQHVEYSGFAGVENEVHGTSNSLSFSWDLKYNPNFFSMNPLISNSLWLRMINSSRCKSIAGYKQASPLYFDFSVVEDPIKAYEEMFVAGHDHGWEVERPLFTDSTASSVGFVAESSGQKGHVRTDTLVYQNDSNLASSSLLKNLQVDDKLTKPYGGAKWESSLCYFGKSMTNSAGGQRKHSPAAFDMPVDVVIDKCILQEILLQYKYVSHFTIKLLEEGFGLKEHLVALRRYHFMEFADWADLFIMYLYHHKWHIAKASQRIPDIQGFLDLAVQHSSCDKDPYKERLFVYTKAPGMISSTSITGVHAFDFIALGYRVEWPINMILTPGALNNYADIFSFLIRVRLAVFSLTEVWCLLKNLMQLVKQKLTGLVKWDKSHCNFLLKVRHQVNHFVSTLQQYVQSQLSNVSWCKFLYSLKHQVKDVLDLESVHMTYLADSLRLCFLSDDTKDVAAIIENILQCALDFHSCFIGNNWEIGLNQRDSPQLNFSQVFTIKATFEKNLRELYLCYLKSPKHRDSSLCHFWEYLNYNDYYSDVIGNGINQYSLLGIS